MCYAQAYTAYTGYDQQGSSLSYRRKAIIMQLNTLKPAPGACKATKRVGRGQGSGKGGTATKGHKGAQSRSGYKRKRGFEGGQLPLQRRIPRYGFKNPTKVAYKPINLATLHKLAEKEKLASIDASVLMKHGLINNCCRSMKLVIISLIGLDPDQIFLLTQ